MSLRANFLGVDLKAVRKFDYSEFVDEENGCVDFEPESFIHELISFVCYLPDNIKDTNFLSEKLGSVFEHFCANYAYNGRPLFGFEMDLNWSIYAFLTNLELKELIIKIESLPKDYQAKYPLLKYLSQDDKIEILSWLNEILVAGKTLWFWTN